MKEKYTINDQYHMLVSGEKAYNSVWRNEKITMVANGDIQLYYNPAYETILIVEGGYLWKWYNV
jgi:hypothetical protein